MLPRAATPPPADCDAATAEQSLRAALDSGATPETVATATAYAARFPQHLGLQLAAAAVAEAANASALQASALQTASRTCRALIAASPRDWALHELSARLEYRLGNLQSSWNAYRRLRTHQPADAAALLGLVKSGLPLGHWEGLAELDPATVPALVEADRATASNLIVLPVPATAPALLRAGRIESGRIGARATPLPPRRVRTTGPLRIGYVSPDFNDHAVAHQIPRVLELHDRARFTIFGYDIGHDDGSPYRRRLLSACNHVRDCRTLGDSAAAALVAADGIDILVDLAGHTIGSRLGIFARRPAPVQATWLGYPATTGAAFIDYLIGDPIVVAPDLRHHFSEAIAYLPSCYLPADDRQVVASEVTRREAGLPDDAVVLAALHQPYKFEPGIVRAWMRILAQAPRTVLWLRAKEESLQARLRAEAEAHGVDPARLIIDNHLHPKPAYLARLALADLFLDTRYFNGHSTVSDALWAGVPVVTTPGDAFAGRVAASILTANGLPELIAPDLDAYVPLAVSIALSGPARAALRERVRRARTTGRFFTPSRFAHELESAFMTMASRNLDGLAPADFHVPPAAP